MRITLTDANICYFYLSIIQYNYYYPPKADLLMIKQKSLIGMELDCRLHTIEAIHINRLYHALHSQNYFVTGKSSTPITEPFHYFPTFLLGNLINFAAVYRALRLNIDLNPGGAKVKRPV